ncbi:putative holin-like toxin [Paenibacillus xylaniclasticus]|uniref:putative holin-like toxin n=1 Tax=Paenibacillus xylaniclasticus TaxID=588083 RepID=UPI0035A23FDB
MFPYRWNVAIIGEQSIGQRTSPVPRLRPSEGGDRMEVYQALTLMISFAMLVVTLLAFHKKK